MDERMGPRAWRECYAHPGKWGQTFPPLALTEMFAASAAEHGDRALVDFLGRQFTYREIEAQARSFAGGLQSLGIGKGDRVGLYLPNVPTYLPAYFGALIAGATVVSFPASQTSDELAVRVADSGTRLLVTLDSPALLPATRQAMRESGLEWLVVARLAPQLPVWRRVAATLFGWARGTPIPAAENVFEWDELLLGCEPVPAAIDPLTDVALVQYTGEAKGVMLSHQNLTANARQIDAIDPHAHRRDVILGGLPLSHALAQSSVLNRTVCNGGMITMLPRFQPGPALAAVERTRVTVMAGVPAMYQAMLEDARMVRADCSSLFTCLSGSAPLPGLLKARFEKASGAKLVEGYAATETGGIAASNPFDGREVPGSIGHPLPGTDLRLLDRDDPTRDAASGAPGELAVSGPQVMLGYWNRAELEPFVEREGKRWLRTGDVATIDEDGYVHIIERRNPEILAESLPVFS